MERRRPLGVPAERVLLGTVKASGPVVHGYVLDPEREGEALVVELLVDGLPLDILRADLFDATLASEGARYPYHGFRFILPDTVYHRALTAEVRLANDGTLVGGSQRLSGSLPATGSALPPGWLAWDGGLSFSGWLGPSMRPDASLRGLIDENLVVEARPRGWTVVQGSGGALAVPAFAFDLPARFADGLAHRLDVVTEDGQVLSPGPVTFVAFDDGLATFLAGHSDVAAEQIRGALYDQLIPQALPLEAVEDWRRRFPLTPSQPATRAVAVVLIGDDDLDRSLESLQDQRDLWIAGVMAWRGERAEFDPADLAAFLETEATDCEAVVFALGGTVFLPGALSALAAPLLDGRDDDCAYGDILVRDEARRLVPLAFPAFDRERMIEQGYAASFFAFSRPAALAAARAGANSLFRLFHTGSGIDAPARRAPLHVPGFWIEAPPLTGELAEAALADAVRHLCANSSVPSRIDPVPQARLLPAIRLRRRPSPCLVSVVILVRNDADDLRRCYAALKAQEATCDIELIVVDNDSATVDAADLLAEIASDGVQIVRVRGPRNVARSMNCGAAIASGTYLCFIDQHVALTTPDALDELLSRCASEGTGAVGGLLTWPSGVVADGGLVLNFREGATRALAGCTLDDPGYGELLLTAREVSAVSSEFMMVGRDTFLAAGGMDETVFPLFFPSVAFCLANAALGQRTVLTPHARGAWHGAPMVAARDPELAARYDRELDHLRSAWPAPLANDPHYSPLLNLGSRPYTGLAWPPRDTAPRRPAAASRPFEAGAAVRDGLSEPSMKRFTQGEHR